MIELEPKARASATTPSEAMTIPEKRYGLRIKRLTYNQEFTDSGPNVGQLLVL